MRAHCFAYLSLLVGLNGCAGTPAEEPEPEPGPSSPSPTAGAGGRASMSGGGGTGGGASASGGASGGAGGAPASAAGVFISEIMYHPVGEDTGQDLHEFIELHNPGTSAVSLRGWKLSIDGKPSYDFPDAASIPSRGYLVVAKSKEKLAAVAKYGLQASALLGDYMGELDNGGGTVALLDGKGAVVDSVKYDDEAPWPIGADAFGAQDDFLPADLKPDKHKYMGRSLERYSFAVPGNEARNWEASPVDGATPGKMNSVGGEPPATALAVTAAPAGGMGLIRASNQTTITVELSPGRASELAVEWFVDSMEMQNEPRTTTAMTAAGTRHTATLPAQKDASLVRYRILGKRAGDRELISPRPTDPYAWHAYFVTPQTPAGRTHHILINLADWSKMWTNTNAGPNSGCTVNASWNARVPAVFIHEGKVHDVQVRHSGSRYQRRNGTNITHYMLPRPAQPSPLRTQTWRVSFPRYAEFNGDKAVNLNKQFQACPGPLNALESKLFWAAGVPTNRYKYARLYINGGYYHYMMEVENIDDRLIERYEGKGKPVGDLFKSDGAIEDQGPWARGDWSPVRALCNYTARFRYMTTYERKTHDWKGESGHDEIVKIIEELAMVRPMGNAAIRAHLEKHFDVPALITQYLIRNFAGTWDDTLHNFFPYKRPSDGKWIILPQDFDLDWGGWPGGPSGQNFGSPATKSLFDGGSLLKNAVRDAFRPEMTARAIELLGGILKRENVEKLLAESLAEFDRTAWMESSGRSCDLDMRVGMARTWLNARYTHFANGPR